MQDSKTETKKVLYKNFKEYVFEKLILLFFSAIIIFTIYMFICLIYKLFFV
jgi:hypothetical protein